MGTNWSAICCNRTDTRARFDGTTTQNESGNNANVGRVATPVSNNQPGVEVRIETHTRPSADSVKKLIANQRQQQAITSTPNVSSSTAQVDTPTLDKKGNEIASAVEAELETAKVINEEIPMSPVSSAEVSIVHDGEGKTTQTNVAAVASTENAMLPEGVIARMPDGTDIKKLKEIVRHTVSGEPKYQEGVFSFDDPKTKSGEGAIEFDANITSECMDLANIFNYSHKKGALDLVIWHLTKNIEREEFKVSGIANDDLFGMCEKYGMKRDGDCMVGMFSTAKQKARQRLIERGWTLTD
jgi:hypothetical protein